jgi:hypothetical protein
MNVLPCLPPVADLAETPEGGAAIAPLWGQPYDWHHEGGPGLKHEHPA